MGLRTISFTLLGLLIFSASAGVVLSSRAALADAVTWRAAAGIGARPDYEGGDDYEAVPIGALRATWKNA